jgi:NAD(P)-dependent dehydrogenase (short-subunit alcohol dehydrogenase family)
VTGANKGIGEETAHLLGDQGHPVLLGCRDAQRAANAERQLRDRGIDAHGLHLDVTDPSSLDKAAKRVSDHYGHLDVLVNNAGIASTDAPQVEDIPSALRRLLDTNVIGAVAVIEAMLPLLRQAPASRIINVSSELGSIACTLDPNSPMWHTRRHRLIRELPRTGARLRSATAWKLGRGIPTRSTLLGSRSRYGGLK